VARPASAESPIRVVWGRDMPREAIGVKPSFPLHSPSLHFFTEIYSDNPSNRIMRVFIVEG
jgi:hypothetical protein